MPFRAALLVLALTSAATAQTAPPLINAMQLPPGMKLPQGDGKHDAHTFYPEHARHCAESGTTLVEFTVGADAVVSHVAVITPSGHADLDVAANIAVHHWNYQPATQDGVPIAVRMRANVMFLPFDEVAGDDCDAKSTQAAADALAAQIPPEPPIPGH